MNRAIEPMTDTNLEMTTRRWTAVWLMAALCPSPAAFGQEDRAGGLLERLLSSGIAVAAGPNVPLSPPIVDPEGTREQRSAAFESVAGSRGWDQFCRKSVVAPVRIDLDYLRDSEGERIGQRLHLAFVVHVGIETLRDADMMRQLLGGADKPSERPEGFHSEPIEHDVLKTLGIGDLQASSFSWLEFILLKKVELQSVIRSQRTTETDFVTIAWEVDDRFTGRDPADDRYRNEWVRRDRDEVGNETRSEPQSYSGAGGYLVVSRLEGLDDASLVEAEIVFSEPDAWFSGSNLLRSKLPLIVQESVRRFRRGLR